MEKVRSNETKLANMRGISPIINPYMNHKAIPIARNTNMVRDISFADLPLYIFMAWGTNAEVVMIPAMSPIISEKFFKISIAMFINYILYYSTRNFYE